MSGGVMSVNADARLLVNPGVSAMPVIDNRGVMVGLLSEVDLIRHTGDMTPTEVSGNKRPAKAMAEARSKRVADV
jgi:sporulation protein YlmC with PRC-barrel domain